MNGGYAYDGTYADHTQDQEDNDVGDDIMAMDQSGLGDGMGGQSLDDIVHQNAKAMRRQSHEQGYSSNTQQNNPDMRRISMMEYAATSPVDNFQYDSSAAMGQSGMLSGSMTPNAPNQQPHPARRQSDTDLSLDTNFAQQAQGFNSLMPMSSAYASPAHPQSGMDMIDMVMQSPYLDSTMGMNMGYGFDNDISNTSTSGSMQMNLFNQPRFNESPMNSPMNHSPTQEMSQPSRQSSRDPSSGLTRANSHGTLSRMGSHGAVRHPARPASVHMQSFSAQGSAPGRRQSSQNMGQSSMQQSSMGFAAQPQNPAPGSQQDRGIGRTNSQNYDGVNGPVRVNPQAYNPNNQGFSWEPQEGGWPSTMVGRPHMSSSYKNAYSSSGFDMLGVLMRIANRPNPEINIGSVDLSCAFVVCDAEKDDFPIVYCSDNFERLTGYTKHMILGRNCRFLQSPDGNVSPGVKRKYVDDDSVLYLKNMVTLRRESQISLINYRRGGQPFMNLLTMIPITWDTDQVKFFVGFQVDLVEQPNAVTNKNPDGSYAINYQRGMTMPRYVLNAPEATPKAEFGQTIPRDDVSAILGSIGGGESEYTKRVWDKLLLENTDDVVHVLSLKGLFQWVSPSALRVLEYEPSEIIGTALSSVCHPSDIVPVTRELKDTSTGASVNVVFRIRRKNSGYMWFEGHGSLHTEQGKGRKSIIMVGRERPVYTLSKANILNNGGIGENELWTKMSTSGMFLYVSSNVRQLLDRPPEELVGVSMQSLMRTESKSEFARILEHARVGKKASAKHEMINRRGQVLSAHTTLYPGDATEGLKPTFIVAQTRFIKFSRGNATSRPPIYPKSERNSQDSTRAESLSSLKQDPGHSQTPKQGMSTSAYMNTDGSAATYAGQDGLLIGHQDQSLASEDNLFDELKTTKSSSWQYEIRQLEKRNRMLAEEVQALLAAKKKRKRRKGAGNQQKDCANCHTHVTPEWRRGPSGQRDLCNSCGLRWAKLNGRVSPRTSIHTVASDKASRASVSPANVAVKSESPMATTPGTRPTPPSARPTPPSPKVAQKPAEGHSAQMEGASGVPSKIDEGDEPD